MLPRPAPCRPADSPLCPRECDISHSRNKGASSRSTAWAPGASRMSTPMTTLGRKSESRAPKLADHLPESDSSLRRAHDIRRDLRWDQSKPTDRTAAGARTLAIHRRHRSPNLTKWQVDRLFVSRGHLADSKGRRRYAPPDQGNGLRLQPGLVAG